MTQYTSQPDKSRVPKLFQRIALLVLFLALGGGFLWSYVSYQDAKKQLDFLSSQEGQAAAAQREVDALLANVGRLILLLEDEDPLVATIQDAEALAQEEPFYQNAGNGDKLIVYTQKAIIYDPDDDRLVNVGPVFIQDQSPDASQDESSDSVSSADASVAQAQKSKEEVSPEAEKPKE